MDFLPKDIEDIIMRNKYALETAERYKSVLRDIESIKEYTYVHRRKESHLIVMMDRRFSYIMTDDRLISLAVIKCGPTTIKRTV